MIVRATIFSHVLLALLASSLVAAIDVPPDLTSSAYISKADALLAQGEFNDALQFYDAAVKLEPQNYLSLFKRGATYLSLNRLNHAMSDFDSALEMKSDFDSALMQRGKLRLKMGDWYGARRDFKALSGDQTENIQSVTTAEKETKAAELAKVAGKVDECISHANAAIMYASAYAPLRTLRSECRLARGMIREAVADLSHLINTNLLSPEPHVRVARLQFFYLNERDRAIAQLAKCLHYDPDAKECKRSFREYKKLDRELKKADEIKSKRRWLAYDKAVVSASSDRESLLNKIENIGTAIDKAEHIPSNAAPKELELDLLESVCEAYFESHKWAQGEKYCSRVLQHHPESVSALLFTAQVHLNNEEFQDAIAVLNKAKEATGGQDRRVMDMLRDATVLQKRANSKDYYKVLGVARDADEKTIRKGYRNKTKEFHPDKYRGDLKPEQVEKKMAEINEAYEVLSTPELKQRFDNGDDPNDHASSGGGGGGGGYQGGFNPFQHQQYSGGFQHGGGGGPNFFQQRTYYQQSGGGPHQQGGSFKFQF
ncbi:hypothetical protein V1512DRAFT_256420 [Lipomyces arxii]|uniref:uncharacterized protein n=1 Tax=Lipomyces arxii TaxID=56418 RepID=UPI0034CD9D31